MNMSCPFCGDSKANKRKARGYIYQHKGSLTYHCHNCGISAGVGKILQLLDPMLYDEYIKERFVNPNPTPKILDYVFEPPKFTSVDQLKDLKRVDQFADAHPVRAWVNGRLIPEHQHNRLYFAKQFMHWTNTLLPEKFDEEALKNDEPRLIIPLVDDQRGLLGFQGRSFKKNSALRYITIMLDENHPKIFGWDKVDPTKRIYVTEGPLDSLFLPNALASAGADLTSNIDIICADRSNFTLVFDREPRNVEIGKRVIKAIKLGYPVALLPETMNGKDINEYRLSGLSCEQIVDIIDKHTYTGLDAELAFAGWKRW